MTNILFEKRREYVNKEYAKKATGKSLSIRQRTKLFKALWLQARKKFK